MLKYLVPPFALTMLCANAFAEPRVLATCRDLNDHRVDAGLTVTKLFDADQPEGQQVSIRIDQITIAGAKEVETIRQYVAIQPQENVYDYPQVIGTYVGSKAQVDMTKGNFAGQTSAIVYFREEMSGRLQTKKSKELSCRHYRTT